MANTIQHPAYHVVAAIVLHDGEVLCVQKPKTKYAYTSFHWEYPGGKVEQGETEEEALCREMQEEMAYPIHVRGLLSRQHYDYVDFSVNLSFYLCEPADKVHPRQFVLREHLSYAWVAPQYIPFRDWCAADRHITAMPCVVDSFVGTDFQKMVWRALCTIPAGETRTYSEVARMIGRPTAVRAVAHAIHCNPLAYYIPCHRVVAMHGIGGYAFGQELKTRLLQFESATYEK